MFNEYHDQVLTAIDDRMKDIVMVRQEKSVETYSDGFTDSVIDSNYGINVEDKQHRVYTYIIKMWHVPKNFTFPSNVKLPTG